MKKSYKTLTISFRDAGSITFDETQWTDYLYNGKFIVVKYDEAWIAMYNADEVFSVVMSD